MVGSHNAPCTRHRHDDKRIRPSGEQGQQQQGPTSDENQLQKNFDATTAATTPEKSDLRHAFVVVYAHKVGKLSKAALSSFLSGNDPFVLIGTPESAERPRLFCDGASAALGSKRIRTNFCLPQQFLLLCSRATSRRLENTKAGR